MTLELTLPLGKETDVKNLVFSILTKEYPLKLIELVNYIRKRYGKAVTFQAVRKAVLRLVEEEVIIQEEHKFSINKEWVKRSKAVIDNLYIELNKDKTNPHRIDSIKGEISVLTFNSLNELMKFWENLIDNWFENFKKGDPKINAYQAAHIWEVLLHPDREKSVMEQLKKKGILSYAISTGNSPLDKNTIKFCRDIGINAQILPSSSSFDKSYYVGTYGDLVVQTQYPEELVKALDTFFRKNTSIEKLDLKELSDIANKKLKMKLTVIKNLAMAKQINKSIIDQIKQL